MLTDAYLTKKDTSGTSDVPLLSLGDLYKLQSAAVEEITIIDVRPAEEYDADHIPSAINIPLEELLAKKILPKDSYKPNIVIVGNIGTSPHQPAVMHLRELGFRNVAVLAGGMTVWRPTLNQLIRTEEFEKVQRLFVANELLETEFTSDTLNIALLTGNPEIIFTVIEAGAKANEDSIVCAAISAPVFINVIFNMLKAEGKDLKTQLFSKYGSIMHHVSATMAISEEITARVRLLEVNEFWKSVWIARQRRCENPNFHHYQVKSYLGEYLSAYKREEVNVILVPFCGKSVDMIWLQQQGYQVIGVDLSDEATDAFFRENALNFTKEKVGEFIVKKAECSAGSLTILCGDILKLKKEHLDGVQLVYDRAGYNSVPAELRQNYARLLTTYLPPRTKVLLGVLDFEGQGSKSGPPYFISDEELSTNLGSLEVTVHAEKREEYFFNPVAPIVLRPISWLRAPDPLASIPEKVGSSSLTSSIEVEAKEQKVKGRTSAS